MENRILPIPLNPTVGQIIAHRLRAHHLDAPVRKSELLDAVGVCGMQNTPPGVWETAVFNRVEGVTREEPDAELYDRKRLLQAWSLRGAPFVFPARESGVFLDALCAREGEPWIYTNGISLLLERLGTPFGPLLELADAAAGLLEAQTVKSKSALDHLLAEAARERLPDEKRAVWDSPSGFGPGQTVGEAAVSFLLRPCSFRRRVVFGRREGASPTFTGFGNWTGGPPPEGTDFGARLVEKFLRAYAPAGPDRFAEWLGCSPEQARRLWDGAGLELAEFAGRGKPLYALADGLAGFEAPIAPRLLLLSAHDPYLGLYDRETILPDKRLQRLVWRTNVNPGAVLENGRITGIWKTGKPAKAGLSVQVRLWETPGQRARAQLAERAERWAAFRGQRLASCEIDVV